MTDSTFTMTYSQAKNVIMATDRMTLELFLDEVNNQPDFIELWTFDDMLSIYSHGTEDVAHTSVFYNAALLVMTDETQAEQVTELLESGGIELVFNPENDTFKSFCSALVSSAVEKYINNFCGILDEVY